MKGGLGVNLGSGLLSTREAGHLGEAGHLQLGGSLVPLAKEPLLGTNEMRKSFPAVRGV